MLRSTCDLLSRESREGVHPAAQEPSSIHVRIELGVWGFFGFRDLRFSFSVFSFCLGLRRSALEDGTAVPLSNNSRALQDIQSCLLMRSAAAHGSSTDPIQKKPLETAREFHSEALH